MNEQRGRQATEDMTEAGLAILGAFDGRYERPPLRRRGRIISVPKHDDGTFKGFALAQIDGENGLIDAKLPRGAGDSKVMAGQEWTFTRPVGQVVGGGWECETRLDAIGGNDGDSPEVTISPPDIPAPEFGGYLTQEGRDSDNLPGGLTLAAVWFYPRSIQSGFNLYSQQRTAIAYQIRKDGDLEWSQTVLAPHYPPRLIEGTLATALDVGDTVCTLAFSAEDRNFVLEDQAAYWRVGTEIVLGRFQASDNTLHVVWHFGPAEASLGLGFMDHADGRGQDLTDEVDHAIGTKVSLLSAQFFVPDLDPGSGYEIRIASVTSANRQGYWSDPLAFDTWEKTTPPPTPATVNVDQLQAGLDASWSSVFRADVHKYRIWRYDPTLNGGAIPTSDTSATPPALGSTQVAELDGLFYHVPSRKGSGNYIGVQAVNDSGIAGNIRWGIDNVPPPHPNPAHWSIIATASGLQVRILPTFYTSGSGADKGFAGIRAYTRSSPAAGDAGPPPNTNLTKSAEAGKVQAFNVTDNPVTLDYFQLSAFDWAGNESVVVADPGYWKRDDGAPNAPAGFSSVAGSVEALQGEFRVRWTLPAAADLAKVKQWRIDRATAGPTGIESHYVDGRVSVFNWSARDYTALAVAGALFFRVVGIGWNDQPGTPTAWAQDLTAPAAPAASNVIIQSMPGEITIRVSEAENPFADPSWSNYALVEDAFGSAVVRHRFRAMQDSYEPAFIETTGNYQLLSEDWVGNISPVNPANWRPARAFYPTNSGMPANGGFEQMHPASTSSPRYWGEKGLITVPAPTAPATANHFPTSNWENNPGASGANYMRWRFLSTTAASQFNDPKVSSDPVPVGVDRSYDVEFSVLLPVAVPNGHVFRIIVLAETYTTYPISGPPTANWLFPLAQNLSGSTMPAGSWLRVRHGSGMWPKGAYRGAIVRFIGLQTLSGYTNMGTGSGTSGIDDVKFIEVF